MRRCDNPYFQAYALIAQHAREMKWTDEKLLLFLKNNCGKSFPFTVEQEIKNNDGSRTYS